MADGKKKCSKDTGTVPKVKYWKNSPHHETHVTNNLSNSSMLGNAEGSHSHSGVRNGQRCVNYECQEDSYADDTRVCPNYNSLPFLNMSGGTSPNTSGSTSRRHSSGTIRKCDNVSKYPDKKQIEEKLNQIREYLKVTSSLMTNVKDDQSNSDESDDLYQMLSALQDSERKLEALLINREQKQEECSSSPKDVNPTEVVENGQQIEAEPVYTFQNNVAPQNEVEYKLEISEKKLQALHDQQNVLMRLQEKAEDQLKDARKVQERLAQCANSQYLLTPDKNKCVDISQMIDGELDSEKYQDELGILQGNNESRGQLIQMINIHDNHLCVEQTALHQKLQELNCKKQQIDHLVTQLHAFGSENEEGDDMGNQIRQIVAMKEQLATLKDMLSAVKSTEASLLQNHAGSAEPEEHTPNIKSQNVGHFDSIEVENRPELERRWSSVGKQSNKSSVSSSREQLQLHAELQAKKQELEELMYKDQDHTSAINQDVCNEMIVNKSQAMYSVETLPGPWAFLQDNTPPRETCTSRENVYSSEEEELDYPPVNNVPANKVIDLRQCNFEKQSTPQPVNGNVAMPATASTSSFSNYTNPPVPVPGTDNKQLELMMTLCQSLLEQQQVIPSQVGVPNFQWFSSYMQMQQALMLSTISQCCQLLWMQQQDINNLVNTVQMMQQNQKYPRPMKVPATPSENVPTACSMPNLTTRISPADTEYPVLVRNGEHPQRNASRNSAIHVMPDPPALWTGVQALNNQVAPGNRANNYWDNFRSYSRQNLLSTSTKSNEGSQNSIPVIERSNVISGMHQPVSRSRSQQSAVKRSTPIQEIPVPVETNNHGLHVEQGGARHRENNRNRVPCRNRNEWARDNHQSENATDKHDVLQENIYKEVTQLISANESRPHYLIQLFKELQHIRSDSLRHNALQSIQTVITDSIAQTGSLTPNQMQENSEVQSPSPRQVTSSTTPVRPKPAKSHPISNGLEPMDNRKLDPETQQVLMELLPFLKFHNEDIFRGKTIDLIILKIYQLLPNKNTVSNNKLRNRLEHVLWNSLKIFQGRRIMDIKEDLLKSIANVLLNELPISSLAKNQQSPMPDNHQKPTDNVSNQLMFLALDNNRSSPYDPVPFMPFEQKSHTNQTEQKYTPPNFSQLAFELKAHPNLTPHKREKKGLLNYIDTKGHHNFVDQKAHSNFVDEKSHPNYIEPKIHPNYAEQKIQQHFMDLKIHPNYIEQKGHPNLMEQKAHSNYVDPNSHMNYPDLKGHPNFVDANAQPNAKTPRVDNGDLAEADQSRREAENEEGAVGGVLVASCKTPDHHGNNCDVCFS